MSCGKLTPEVQKHLSCSSTTNAHELFTDWIPCIGVDTARVVIKNKAVTGNFRAKVSVQTAEVRTNNPSALTDALASGYQSGAGERYELLDLSATTPSKFFVRFGVAYSTTDGEFGEADVSLQVSYGMKGRVVGSASAQLVAPDTTSLYFPIGGWVPAIEASKFKAAYVITNAANDFKSRMAYQTAATSVESPDNWDSTDSLQAGNLEECSGELTPTTTDKMWIRFALQYVCAIGTTNQGAMVSVAVAIRG